MDKKIRLDATEFYDFATNESPDTDAPSIGDVAPAHLLKRIGRYRIEKVLGKGGFGLVYLAHDEQLDRLVAIKVPHAQLISAPADVEAYLVEARTVASLDHPGIVPVHDVGSTVECPCYVISKYIPGTDLATKLKAHRLNYREAAELVAAVADALHFAHKQGLVHRDVKPGNILIGDDGKPYVVDFGLALREENVGKGPTCAGTAAYMSPEQARGESHRVDGRSDVFSLGVVFYELLAGRPPFRGETRAELLEQVISYEPRPLLQYDERLPKELQRICLKALSKRSSERYSSAHELAEDLRQFLQEQTVIHSGASPGGIGPIALSSAASASPGLDSSDSQPIKIVPKGLRSFDAHDADFFLELLPGPCDRQGLPDSLRFWKTRIEETDADNTFAVGLIYGPSGCGKSSLVKAGLLPRLSENVIPVYIEATPEETETRLRHGLRKQCSALEADLSLTETLAALRRGQGLPAGKKVLIVLDQFEQWLHSHKEEQNCDLVHALRQCDGGRVQCIVMVRDDFWMAVSRFLRELEVRLLEAQNAAAVDLFPIRHAQKVLAAFGRAFGTLPDNINEMNKEQKSFVAQSVAGLAEEGNVVCVRLALFAEMIKGKSWTPATLKEVGGAKGVGVAFLEETFSSSTASPEHRYHQKAARAALKALLPESGTDIKGQMKSYDELLEASGYARRSKDFDDLIRILDSEIRLITPTDPEGTGDNGSVPASTRSGQKYYQLTHDYLVHSLRDWLTRKQQETRRGRAELRLVERAALWQAKPEHRHLPSWWEYLTAVWLVPAKYRTASQQKMLRQAGRVHAFRSGAGLAILLLLGFTIGNVVSTERQASLRQRVATAVDAVQNNRSVAVPLTLRELQKLPRAMVVAELQGRYASAEPQHKLGLAYARAAYGDIDADYLCAQIERAGPDEVDNLVTALRQARETAMQTIEALAKKAESAEAWRLKSRLALVGLHLGNDRLAAEMCRIADRPDPIQRTLFIDEVSTWHGNVAPLAASSRSVADAALRSGLCLAVGSISSDRSSDPEKIEAWKSLLAEWYETAPDTATHSAAGWTLRHWAIEAPPLRETSQPSAGRQWFVNSLGMTLLKIEPGVFVRSYQTSDEKDQTVQLTRAYFLCDREISVGQFQQFVDDAAYPAAEKPEKWPGAFANVSPTPDHPVQVVDWYDAVLFCNWLSRKEGRTACYERIGRTKMKGRNPRNPDEEVDVDDWRLAPDRTGYRLPTEAEWEYACRAGTTTDYACGSGELLLRRYACFQSSRALPGGSLLPNGWGLFDMHGNVWDWCHDWYGLYGDGDARDPVGPAEGSTRVCRGGSWYYVDVNCRSWGRGRVPPDERNADRGFRPALISSGK